MSFTEPGRTASRNSPGDVRSARALTLSQASLVFSCASLLGSIPGSGSDPRGQSWLCSPSALAPRTLLLGQLQSGSIPPAGISLNPRGQEL